MPLKTFENLEEKRKQEILEACFEEFALNTYSSASLSRIIKKLGLAKGSFYRYFKSKKELYSYLLQYSTSRRMREVKEILGSEKKSLYEKMVENFSMKVRFDIQHPLLSGFQYNVMKERYNKEIGNIDLQIKKEILNLVKKILITHTQKGEIRDDIDPDIITFLIMQVQIGIYDFLELKYNIDFQKNIKEKKPVFSITEAEIMDVVKSFSNLLENGFIKRMKL